MSLIVCVILYYWFVHGRIKKKINAVYAINIKCAVLKIQYSGQHIQYSTSYFSFSLQPCSSKQPL